MLTKDLNSWVLMTTVKFKIDNSKSIITKCSFVDKEQSPLEIIFTQTNEISFSCNYKDGELKIKE